MSDTFAVNDTFIDKYEVTYKVVPYDGDLTLTIDKEWYEDWSQIEKAVHDGEEKFVQTDPNCYVLYRSARISNASVEGPLHEMKDIADAILSGKGCQHYRCAVAPHNGGFVFWSPRNSVNVGWVTADVAIALAKEIQSIQSIPEYKNDQRDS